MQASRPFTKDDVRHRRFCCCIPVRWGTLLLSLLGATLAACLGIQATIRLFAPTTASAWRVLVEVASIVLWFSLVVLCLYGWSGCIMQKREWVDWFYELVWWHLWVNAVVGIYTLILLALPGSKALAVGICTQVALDALQLKSPGQELQPEAALGVSLRCFTVIRTGLILLDLAWVVAMLIELWLCLVIGHYLDELADREAAEQYGVDIENADPPYRFQEVAEDPQTQLLAGRRQAKRF
ncbi:hypothetical protein JCM10450v2_004478 [Rhodotorula kratochvilovae]